MPIAEPPVPAGHGQPTVLLRLSPVPAAIRTARRHVAVFCQRRGLDELTDTAMLLTSEVVTNAIRHGTGEITLTITHARTALLIQVTDHSPEPPRLVQPDPGPETLTGRGLHLVQRLATSWDYNPHPGDGKTVRFTLAVSR